MQTFKIEEEISASGSVGGVRPCQGRGRGFESRLALLRKYSIYESFRVLGILFLFTLIKVHKVFGLAATFHKIKD